MLIKKGLQSDSNLSYWTSATFWPLIVTKFNSPQKFVKDYFIIKYSRRYIKLGDYKESYRLRGSFIGSFIEFCMEKYELYD